MRSVMLFGLTNIFAFMHADGLETNKMSEG